MGTTHDPRTARILSNHGWLYGVSPTWSDLACLRDRKVSCPSEIDDHFQPHEASVWVHYSNEKGTHVSRAPTVTASGRGGSVSWTLVRWLTCQSNSTVLRSAALVADNGRHGVVYKGHRTRGLNSRL
jgi:hypothetical protein